MFTFFFNIILSLYLIILSLYLIILSLYLIILSLYLIILSLYLIILSLYLIILSLYLIILSLYLIILSLYLIILSLYLIILKGKTVQICEEKVRFVRYEVTVTFSFLTKPRSNKLGHIYFINIFCYRYEWSCSLFRAELCCDFLIHLILAWH